MPASHRGRRTPGSWTRRPAAPIGAALALLVVSTLLIPPAAAPAAQPGRGPTPEASRVLPFEEDMDRILHGPACSIQATAPGMPAIEMGCDPGGDEGSAGPQAKAAGSLTLTKRTSIQTPRGTAGIAPFNGTVDEAFVVVHRFGDVSAYAPNGDLLWTRASMTFHQDWGLVGVGRAPVVLLPTMINPFDPSTDPLNATTLLGERAFSLGDLTGDGVDEIVVGHYVVLAEDEDGDPVFSTSAVTVLDGRDGAALWTRLFPGYVMQTLVRSNTVLIGNVSGNPQGGAGEPGTTSRLEAFRFSFDGQSLSAAPAWSVDTGTAWARWMSLEPAGPGRAAAAWSRGTAGSGGAVLLLDVETGEALWTTSTPGFPRTLRYDATREQVVMHEQASGSAASFTVSGLRVEDGSVASSVTSDRAALASLAVADVTGSGQAEWLIGEYLQVQGNSYYHDTVRAVDPDSGATRWSETRGTRATKSPVPQTIEVVPTPDGAMVVAASLVVDYGKSPVRLTNELRAYVGGTGAVAWSHEGDPIRGDDPAHPAFLAAHRLDGNPVVLTTTMFAGILAHDVADGTTRLRAPTMAEPLAVHPLDVDGDGTTDLVVGTEGGGVYALDGRQLHDAPGILWWAATDGPVRTVELADLDGDGRDEAVVATTNGVEALDLTDGSRRYRIDYPEGDFVFTANVGDVSGDGRPDILVPTRTVAAYDGTDGEKLWEVPAVRDDLTATYFSNVHVTEGGDVAVQFIEHSAWRTPSSVNTLLAGPYVQRQFLALLDGSTGAPEWIRPTDSTDRPTFMPRWRAVVAGPTGDEGPSAVFTYERQSQFPNLSSTWRPGLYAHSASTGDELWRGRSSAGVVHMGTVARGDRALEFSWGGLLSSGASGTWDVDVGVTSDVADADLGPAGKAFLTNYGGHVHVYSPEVLEEGGPPPVSLAEHSGLTAGRFLATDLDGDGADEVLTYWLDWWGFTVVSATSGMLVIRLDSSAHGIDILEAGAA